MQDTQFKNQLIDIDLKGKTLPAVTSADEGKVLTVDSSGAWTASEVVSNYTVNISLTNPANPGQMSRCEIWTTASNSFMDRIEQKDTLTSPTGSSEFTVDDTIFGVQVEFYGSSVSVSGANATCTGGANLVNTDSTQMLFEITGDCTITISGVDYDD